MRVYNHSGWSGAYVPTSVGSCQASQVVASNFSKARGEILKALQISPQFANVYAELGLLDLKQKQHPAAEEALRKAIEISPDNYTANLNLMIMYQRTNDPRAEAQAKRFEEISKQRNEKQKEFLRMIEVKP